MTDWRILNKLLALNVSCQWSQNKFCLYMGDHLVLNSEVKMFLAGQVQKASRTVFEMPQ